ncbi:WecB/TagA/CpsF family glycosyltransferase [Alicyclobacillus sp. SO9]|uniref:WecB/TagA/CpsF family glycosyltransferase n=1 Tax=Alicyclobacillus sp. SO9 TaxID=2665646 RepID=UPI001E51BEC3|nr:WecB/TagA/CpsF family glycosyltransferase [Alicyclobacillus sp. SO9]
MQRGNVQYRAHHSIEVLGIRFNKVNLTTAVEQILHWVSEKSRRMVITAGPEFVMHAERDKQLKKMAFVADLVTPDGIGVLWAAKRIGNAKLERVTGVELGEALLQTAQTRNIPLRVYILGARGDSLAHCLDSFRTAYPSVIFAGRDGYFENHEWSQVKQEIEAFQPDVWFVGLGQPRQEKLIFESLAGLPPCVGIGVGGSIDVWSGVVQRAPKVVQRVHLEWFYRLVREPSRWKRQLALPRFAWKVVTKRS